MDPERSFLNPKRNTDSMMRIRKIMAVGKEGRGNLPHLGEIPLNAVTHKLGVTCLMFF